MLDEKTAIRAELLALTNVLFWPHRWNMTISPGVVWTRRQAFATRGLVWHPADKSEPGRKAAWRVVADLEADGLAERFKGSTNRTLSLRLTAAGDVLTRREVGPQNQYAEVVPNLKLLLDLEKQKGAGAGRFAGYVSECTLAQTAYDAPDCREKIVAEQYIWPLSLMLGLVNFNTSIKGHGYYWLTPNGRAIAEGREEFTWPQIDLPEPNEEAAEHYYKAMDAAFVEIRSAKDISELGYIPLPVSLPTRKSECERAQAVA